VKEGFIVEELLADVEPLPGVGFLKLPKDYAQDTTQELRTATTVGRRSEGVLRGCYTGLSQSLK